jgi:hypothetical protein
MTLSDKHVICTLFDHRYLPRGLCMIQSARRHGFTGDIWILCLSDECQRRLRMMELPDTKTVTLDQLEGHIPRLRDARTNRSILEYYFTCMAALHTYLFETVPAIRGTMYVDSDILFFENPENIFDAIGDAPVAITPHNFTPQMRAMERCGVFNGGWTAFRRTPEGLQCLAWWLERSLEWCYDRVEGERYANQAYLNKFPQIAPRTRVLSQKGYNCAPWNIGNYKVTERGGRLWVDDEPMAFFHFHGLKRRFGFFQIQHRDYGAEVSLLMRNKLYRPYIAEMLRHERRQRALSVASTEVAAAADLRRPRPMVEIRHFIGKALRSPWKAIRGLARVAQSLPIVVVGSRPL